MRRRSYIIILILAITAIGAWIGVARLKTHLLASLGPVASPAVGQKTIRFGFDGAAQSNGVPSPWQYRVIKGNLEVDVVQGPDRTGEKGLRVKCDKSHFILWNASIQFNPQEYPVLMWSWKAFVLPTGADVRQHSPIPLVGDNRNDAAVQVLVAFEGNNILSYIWDTTAPIGTEVEEPSPVATVRTQVIDSGEAHLNEWISHRVNIFKDYQRRFGKLPGKVLGISVQTNSNHTDSTGVGIVGPLTACGR